MTPKSDISARLGIRIEDIAAVGQANFESPFSGKTCHLVLSDELDDQAINGAGGNSAVLTWKAFFNALTDPTDPSAVAKFDDFVSAFAGGVDGLWASYPEGCFNRLPVPPPTNCLQRHFVTLAPTTDTAAILLSLITPCNTPADGGRTRGCRTLPAISSKAILYRMGRSGMRTAVCPHWNAVSIDDIYSGSAKGERYFTMHVLLGDVILVQPAAYAQVAFKTA